VAELNTEKADVAARESAVGEQASVDTKMKPAGSESSDLRQMLAGLMEVM
jgi:hypothetical protein